MSEEIKVLFFASDKEKIWESDYIINTLIPNKYTKIAAYSDDMETMSQIGFWDIFVFNCRKHKFNDILDVVKSLNPKIIIQLSDEYKEEDLNHFNILAKYCNLYLREYHHKGYTYLDNTIHIPLGYTNNAGLEFMDILPEGLNKPPRTVDKKYNWAWVGEIKQDRWDMLQLFSNIPFQSYGLQVLKDDMIERYLNANFVPCGRGNSTLDCYRLYEASQCGAIPCLVGTQDEIELTFKYEKNPPWIFGSSWHDVVHKVRSLLFNKNKLQKQQDELVEWWKNRVGEIRDKVDECLQKSERKNISTIGEEKMIQHYWQNDEIFGENWFSYPNLYKDIVKSAEDGDIFVEVGSWKGRSTSCLAVEIANSKKDITLYAVDTWEGSVEHMESAEKESLPTLYETFLRNMVPVEEYYLPLKLTSTEASKKFKDGTLKFVFLDASHEYEDVKRDIEDWMPKVKPGGILAGHDYYPEDQYDWFPGVKKAVNETIEDFEQSELCFIHQLPKDEKYKFENFPSVNYISVKECEERRELLHKKFEDHGIEKFTPHIYERYKEGDCIIESKLLHRLNIGSYGPVTSHLKTIRTWYETTDEPYTIICEDDLGFQTVKYWKFTWDEFFNSLPDDWGCVQLGILREDYHMFDVGFRNRCWCDWSGVAYLISREHAEKLIEAYYKDDIFTLDYVGMDNLVRPEWARIPVIETIVYSNVTSVYCCPLFVEDIQNCKASYFNSAGIRNGDVNWAHVDSFNNTLDFWRKTGKYESPIELRRI
jgi:hypothetical protein